MAVGRSRALDARVLGTLLLGHLMTDLNQGMLPALLPFFIAERGLSYAAAGGLVLAANVSSSVVQPLFGHLADGRPSPWFVPAGVAVARDMLRYMPSMDAVGMGLDKFAYAHQLVVKYVDSMPESEVEDEKGNVVDVVQKPGWPITKGTVTVRYRVQLGS